MKHQDLIVELNNIGVIKFGEFTLKSGIISPVYIDLRILVSYPKVMKKVAEAYVEVLNGLDYDRMAAIPYAAMPIVAAISAVNEKPWVYTRKEVKNYGIHKPMEGEYKKGETVVLVDDLITKGTSKFEAVEPFEKEGLVVKDVVVLIDREQGGGELLAEKGYRLHSVLKISDMLEALKESGVINQDMVETVKDFLKTA